jgi:hypothetical protein
MERTIKRKFDAMMICSQTGTPADVTFHSKDPIINVLFSPELEATLNCGGRADRLEKLPTEVALADGTLLDFDDIWTVNIMPPSKLTEEALAAVDLSEGDKTLNNEGLTLRKIIRQTYHCKTKEQEDFYLRRALAL